MKPDFRQMTFNSVEDIDKLIEAIEKMPENPNKQNIFVQKELSKREKMLQELKELRKEADVIAQQEEERKKAEVIRDENDEIEMALDRAKQLIKTKKAEVKRPLRTITSSYGSESWSSYSSESRYGSGESRW